MQWYSLNVVSMRRKRTAEALLRLTSGLINTTEIFVLFVLSLAVPLPGITSKGSISENTQDIKNILESITLHTIKKTLYNLTFHGLIRRVHHADGGQFDITESGIQKLSKFLPKFYFERKWDGHVYLIYYYLDPKDSGKRERVREFLKSLGCIQIHGGVWLHPYDKTFQITTFMKTHIIPGNIFVSKLHQEGTVGGSSLQDLVRNFFLSKNIGERYEKYIERYAMKHNSNRYRVAIDYLSILQDDPQLPFPLEPINFPAKKALAIFQSATRSV